jgi:PIN domain nuclease of toxin-antitoxin system
MGSSDVGAERPLETQKLSANLDLHNFESGPFREASFTHEVALAMAEISIPHTDPIDAILGATAPVHGLTLITSDHDLARGTGFPLLKNE